MYKLLFTDKPKICCRCGRPLHENEIVYRPDEHKDAVICTGCNPSEGIKYIFLDGIPRAVLDRYMFGEDFHYGFYEFRYVNVKEQKKCVIYRFYPQGKDIDEFINTSVPGSYILRYSEEIKFLEDLEFFEQIECLKEIPFLYYVKDYENETEPKTEILDAHEFDDVLEEWFKDDYQYYDNDEIIEVFLEGCYQVKPYCLKIQRQKPEPKTEVKSKESSSPKPELKPGERFFTPEKAKDFLCFCQKRIIGQGDELKKAVCLVIRYVEAVKSGNYRNKQNWFLTAPSGSGKTEFYRAVRDYFKLNEIDIPVLFQDLSRITPEGYRGSNASDILNIFVANESNGEGIFFLDEADKKFTPSYTAEGDDFNAQAQATLLSLVEGCDNTFTYHNRKELTVDTSKTMFVFLGAYQNIRDIKTGRNEKKHIGFNAIQQEMQNDDFYDVTIEDMIEYGLTEQLAGRISTVINFHRLSEENMINVIRAKVNEIGAKENIKVGMTNRALNEFLKIAYTPTGIRNIINQINGLIGAALEKYIFEDCFDPQKDRILITSLERIRILRSEDGIITPAEAITLN